MIRSLARRKKAPFIVLLAVAATSARAEGFGSENPALFALRWEVAAPLGDLRSKFTDKTSPVGAAGEMRIAVGQRASLGVAATWNRFTGGPASARIDAVASRLTAHYHLSRSWVQPYIGAGAGAAWIRTSSPTTARNDKVGLCADPQLGLLLTLDREIALDINVHYQFTTVSSSTLKDYQWVGAGIGLAFY